MMKSHLIVPCTIVALAAPREEPEAGLRANEVAVLAESLVEAVNRHGLEAVVEAASSSVEKELLLLIADLMNEPSTRSRLLPSVMEAHTLSHHFLPSERTIRESIFAESEDGSIMPVYTVVVSNMTDETVDEVLVFFQKSGETTVHVRTKDSLSTNAAHVLDLESCGQMSRYVLGVFRDRRLAARLGRPGGLTPADIDGLAPSSSHPCSDSWSIADPPARTE